MNLDKLNPNQQAAVLNSEGPLMILAGAGSGKTRTLVAKIQYLMEEKNLSPYKILAVTFSNKAAKEMRDRVAHSSNMDIGALQITTFHSFCARVLRNEASHLGLSRNFTIYDDSESRSIVKAILGKRGISTKELSPYEVLHFISELKNQGYYLSRKNKEEIVSNEFIEENQFLYSLYMEYEAELHKSNAVDFGSLIVAVIELFHKFPEVLEQYKRKYDYVLVDEYQDTNRSQFELIKLITEEKRNLCVVGDEDQSIYSWRGADIRNIIDFEKYYPEAKLIKLEQNYRSSKIIIEAASAVIARNEVRKGKMMWTDNPTGDHINIVECESDKTEGEYVATEIQKLLKKDIRSEDIAIFYRNNAQSRIIEDSLRRLNIPYRVVGGIKFYDRKEVKDLLSYLRVVINPKDSLAISRIINVPMRGIGATTFKKIEDEAVRLQGSLWDILIKVDSELTELEHVKLSKKVILAIRDFLDTLFEAQVMNERKSPPSEIFKLILKNSGYEDELIAKKDYESQARLENLEELFNAIRQFEDGNPHATLTSFLETITLDTSTEDVSNGEKQGEVSLMTVHGAKGLEFNYVFLVGAEENLFPSYKSLEMGKMAIEEERRLFYVAMTRAMDKLTIAFAQGRMLFGQLKFNGPSRFIDEIPSKYYTWKKDKKNYSSPVKIIDGVDYSDEYSQETPSFDWEESRRADKKKENLSTYPKGSFVVHSIYGEGKVVDCDGFGQDEKVLIQFSNGDKKRFMVKFAPLALV